jgi:Na+-translocating ferredoxin:NAD+ oxidoreductase RnfD subunit
VLTFANYELLASPLLFAAFFLATNASVCPLSSRAQSIYAFLFGTLSAAGQLYVSCSIGPYIALLATAQFSVWLERNLRPRVRRP